MAVHKNIYAAFDDIGARFFCCSCIEVEMFGETTSVIESMQKFKFLSRYSSFVSCTCERKISGSCTSKSDMTVLVLSHKNTSQ